MNSAIPIPEPDSPPFVLLDDARADGAVPARLFRDPVETLVARNAREVPALLDALDAAQARGLFAAGYLAYEAGKGLAPAWRGAVEADGERSEEHTSELQSLMRISYAVFCLKKKNNKYN